MLIDDVTIQIKAGNGGRGAVAFQKIKMALGPTGTAGGKGGDIYIEGVSDLSALGQFRHRKVIEAENGHNGRSQFRDGRDGKSITLKIPVGTVVHNTTTQHDFEIIKVGERVLIARGGYGGKGNFHFRAPHNTSPKEFEYGLAGEEYKIRFELKMFADVGLIGLPNAGKSSLLNELTNAQSKVANYPFTTLEPNLGVYYELILADLPGLIEGASEGRGLGYKFLRHVERTKVLFHLVAGDSEDPVGDYEKIRRELGLYNSALLEKKEYILLSKSDVLSESAIDKIVKRMKKRIGSVSVFSNYDYDSLQGIRKILNELIKEKVTTGT